MSNGGWRPDSDERIDRAIDGAVREMLDVEPQAAFRARVLRRIEGDSLVASDSIVASGFRRKILLFGVPLAAAAILILAVLLPGMREDTPPQAPTTSARVETPPEAPRATTPPSNVGTERVVTSERPSVVTPRVASSRSAIRGEARRRADTIVAAASFEPAEQMTTEIEPLRTIAPIQVAPIAHSTITPEEISVRPLNTITAVQIAPLSPPDGRN